MMNSILQICLAFFFILLSYGVYLWLKLIKARRELTSWIPCAPGIPILGSILEFGGSTETINDLNRLTNNPSKATYLEIVGVWSIISRDYDFLEFVLSSNTLLTKSEDYRFLKPWLGTGLLTSNGPKWKKHRRVLTPAFHFSILEQFVDVFNANENVLIEKLKREALGKDSVEISAYVTACTLDIICGPKWKKHRRVLTPAFHFSILEQFVDVFNANENVLIEKLKREALGKDSVEISAYVTACTLDIICETAMGVNIDSQNNNNPEYVKAVKSMCRITANRSLSSWKRFDALFRFTSEYKEHTKNLKILHNFTNSIIEKRKNELESRKENEKSNSEDDLGRKPKMAFLDLLLNSNVDGRPLTQEEIREEVDTFMVAGHDTTGSSISSAFYLLSNHPEVQKQIREELKEIFGNDRNKPITYQDLQGMKYLDLVVKEVLRLYPPAPLIARVTQNDVQYKGHTIPKDTDITLFLHGISRDPDYYEDPEAFKPERFLDTGNRKPYSYLPFSAGPRNCIGQKFALLEMKSMVSKILMNFELLPTNPPHKLLLASEIVLKARNGVKIKLKECTWEN